MHGLGSRGLLFLPGRKRADRAQARLARAPPAAAASLLSGRASAGVPERVTAPAVVRLRIPIRRQLRSLNLAMAVALAAGEALRQTGATIEDVPVQDLPVKDLPVKDLPIKDRP